MANEIEVFEGEIIGFDNVIDYDEKASRVNELQDMIVHSAQNMVQYAIEIGTILIEVKDSLGHGEWLPWVMANCNFGQQWASRYMQLARNYARGRSFEDVSSIKEALRMLEEPKGTKLPKDTETRLLRKEDEFGFPRYEIEVQPGEAESIERSSYETTLIHRNPNEPEEVYDSMTFTDKKGLDSVTVNVSKNSDVAQRLADAFSTIDEVFMMLANLPVPNNNDRTRQNEAAYFLNAIVSGLNYQTTKVNNWAQHNPNFATGDYKVFNEKTEDPIVIEKEKGKMQFQSVM